MPHNDHTESRRNQDLDKYTREDYLEMTKYWTDPLGLPQVGFHDGVYAVRDDLTPGSKARFGDFLFSHLTNKHIVYSQMQFGLAGPSLTYLCKKWNKELTLWMPALAKVSNHQAYCIEQDAKPVFKRVASSTNLNREAKKWAEDNGYYFLPLGLKHHLMTAAIVRVCENIREVYGDPQELYVAVSTGVLSRGLQIGFPKTKIIGVAVSRNLKDGERGDMDVISEPLLFTSKQKTDLPPFPSIASYDAKVWKYIPKDNNKYRWFWNVGSEPVLQDKDLWKTIDSQRPWPKKKDKE